MRALGFDPGTATTGYGVVESRGSRLTHVAHGVIATSPKWHFADRLKFIFEEASRLLELFKPDAVAVERLFFVQNVTNGIQVAQARGVLVLAAAQAGLPVGEFSPTEAKTAVVGYGHADKRQVQEMVKLLLSLDSLPKPDDAADALAMAICQVQTGIVHQRFAGKILVAVFPGLGELHHVLDLVGRLAAFEQLLVGEHLLIFRLAEQGGMIENLFSGLGHVDHL